MVDIKLMVKSMAWYLKAFPKYREEREYCKNRIFEDYNKIQDLSANVRQAAQYKIVIDGIVSLRSRGWNIIYVDIIMEQYSAVVYQMLDNELSISIFQNQDGRFIKTINQLDADIFTDHIKLVELSTISNHGYGSILMRALFELIKQKNLSNATRIVGTLAPTDYKDHKERLLHFYTKYGFKILDTRDENTKIILLDL